MFISVHICKYVDSHNFNFLKVKEKAPRDQINEIDNNLDDSNVQERRDFHVFAFNVDTPGA